jgi:hypothetical protein
MTLEAKVRDHSDSRGSIEDMLTHPLCSCRIQQHSFLACSKRNPGRLTRIGFRMLFGIRTLVLTVYMLTIHGCICTFLAHSNAILGVAHKVGPFVDLLQGCDEYSSSSRTHINQNGTHLTQPGSTSPYIGEDEATVWVPVSICDSQRQRSV